jgi:hypothetical protein
MLLSDIKPPLINTKPSVNTMSSGHDGSIQDILGILDTDTKDLHGEEPISD